MKQKKKEKDKPAVAPENNEADIEKFLQTFEKATKIYRYLRTRHLVSPLFLQRSLWYMKHRKSTGKTRKSFKVDSILEKKKVIKDDPDAPHDGIKYLRLELDGYYDSNIPHGIHEVEVEAIVTRIQHTRKHGACSGNVKQTSLGKVRVPVNPTWSHSSPDGTQSDNGYHGSRATIISKEGIDFRPFNGQNSCSLHLSVTCRLKPNHPNGIANGTISDEYSNKKRRHSLSPHGAGNLEDNVVVYGAELSVYGKQYQCLLVAGTYDLILQERGSKFSTNERGQWERAGGKRPIAALEVFDSSSTLKFKLTWFDDPEGLVPCETLPCEYHKNNRYTPTGYRSDPSQLIKEEGTSTPKKKMPIVYQFLYDENARQMTDSRDSAGCPWCTVNCGELYSLLKHLRLCHARFNFIYTQTPTAHRIDVSLNDCFDGAYAGNPQDLNSHIGFAFHRLGPVRRSSITHVMVYRPKRPAQTLQEFCEPEKENQICRQIIQGHNRLYYRTNTCQPLKPQEINQDSEDEITPKWLCQKSVNLIDEFSDVNEGEKELMKMWNLHCMKYAYIADCQIPQACQTFIEEHGKEIILKNIVKNFELHLVNMFDYSLIAPEIVQRTMWQLYTVRDDLEMSGVIPCCS
ncbi:polycomb protein suz12-like [Dreissena polymorpha]|uniref:Polycomb protein VEFS-Box domain-containing protein n=1 Tax=Dreissena polymorpha TaxID=45954 RepID=A0A9D4MBQ9_DREPO|nr:polycomb protein suz12-like [Dreissena polymorpha]KAH3873319.1 hypothetical protein DPMN_036551 [Dreissena polymorpha]